MNSDRWQQIETLFDAAQGMRGAERSRYLDASCAGDEDLRLEVESLLGEAEHEDGDFLAEPVFAAGLTLLARERWELPRGHQIGRYQIVRALGRGGTGEVYVAEDTHLRRPVSLKLLSSHLTGDEESVARFRLEALAASGVRHPGIAHVYDFGQEEGRHYLAMEYVEGLSLREVLAHESLSTVEAVELASQVAATLVAAHARGVVHRDIKPENIVVTAEGQAKVLDFGLAKLLEARGRAVAGDPLADPAPDRIMGTVAYMSPEQLGGEEVDARTDVWSLGVVLYEMVARRRPFEGETDAERVEAIRHAEPPPVALHGGESAELHRVLSKALVKDKRERYQTAREFEQALRGVRREAESAAAAVLRPAEESSVAAAAGVRHEEKTERTRAAPLLRGRGLKVAVVIVSAVLAASTAAFLMFRGAQSDGAKARQTSAPEPMPPASAKIESLVILPLATEGGGEELSYLAEGVAEDLIRSVGKLGKARVTALTSARKLAGRADDYAEVRRALHADFLLAGRTSENGEALTVNVYLTDLRSGARVWQDSYVSRPGELLQVRNALFVLLSSRLQTMLAGDKQLPLPPASTLNAEAYRAYLRGAYAHDRHSTEGLKRAVASLEHAVSLDPNFALAHSALGDSYNLLGSFLGESPDVYLPKARGAVLRAIALDDTLAPAHASLAKMRMDYDRDWAGAEREFRRAIELNPNYAQAHHWYGEVYLSAMGQLEESLRELQIAHEQDPLSDGILTGLAWSHIGAGEYERAIAECREALALDPQDWSNYSYLAMAQLKLGRYDEALTNAKAAYELERTGANLAMLGAMQAYAGNSQEASRILRTLRAAPDSLNVSKYDLAVVHTALGERDEAFRLLGEEVATLSVDLLSIRIDPMLDPLRDDPRFPLLEARYNFPPDPRRAPTPPGASALRFSGRRRIFWFGQNHTA